MSDSICGRDEFIDTLKKYAESTSVFNQAFLGVKGVGKTSVFKHYFTRNKLRELADKYKKLFVYCQLDSRKSGSDLYQFFLELVKRGIMSISDKEDRQIIKNNMADIDDFFDTPDCRLTQYLSALKELEYKVVIVMDHFHCMARDTEVGSEQYDVLRSYSEQNVLTYWIITDTDLRETCATKQYTNSFFAQKFTNKITVCPLAKPYLRETVEIFASQKKYEPVDFELDNVAEISGGVPEVMSMLIDILCNAKREQVKLTKEELTKRYLQSDGGISLFKSWISGLTSKQKELLYDVAVREEGITDTDTILDISKLAELSDVSGRGLLHAIKDEDESSWNVNVELFRQYVVDCGTEFYHEKQEKCTAETVSVPSVTQIYNINGPYIENQTNNTINIDNAIAGLEDLQKLVHGKAFLIESEQAARKLEYLPFKNNAWKEMNADDQEQALEKYAEGIFASDIFLKGSLSPEQMERFNINHNILDNLSKSCREQIVCGIQVYDLIQLCIDRFGLSMNESESPRGILFARAFESHLKDKIAPAYCRIPELASMRVYPTKIQFKDYSITRTTIGTYHKLLEKRYDIFAQASVKLLGYDDKNEVWWRKLVERLSVIGTLRNNCCHSGLTFGKQDLLKLKKMVFEDGTLEDILLFEQIPKLQRGQFTSKKNVYTLLDESLLGRHVKFIIKERARRGNYRGIVEGQYEGSLPKKYTNEMFFDKVKDTEIDAIVENIQDGKYVLRK